MSKAGECDICRVPYNHTDHRPYVLTCGHNACRTTITRLY